MNMITFNEVPTEIFDEIKISFPILDLSEYGSTEVKADWVSRKLSFQQKLSDLPIEVTIVDPVSFQPKLVTGVPHKCFILRGKFENDKAIVYQVLDAGNVIRT